MSNDGFDTTDVEGAEGFGLLVAEEGCADCLGFYGVASRRSSAMGLKVLRSIGLLVNVQPSTSITVADKGYLSLRTRPGL